MEELIRAVAEKTGVAPEVVRPVAQAVLAELKQRLPEPLSGQLDGLLAHPAAGGVVGQASDMLGGLLGNKS
jgi:hypothetical protein